MAATTPKAGRFGVVYIGATNGGTAVNQANLRSWSLDGATDFIDVTCMGDGNKVELLGFNSFKLSVSGFADPATDVFRVIGDGVPRSFIFQEDTTAATGRYWHGLISLDFSSSGGAGKAIAVTLTGGAAGTVEKTFSATPPSFP